MSEPLGDCEFGPSNEPWTCRVHHGIRTSLGEPECDIARPVEPFNDAQLDNLRRGIAEGRNPGSRYNVRRLLATLDAARADTGELARLREALEPFTRRAASEASRPPQEDDHFTNPDITVGDWRRLHSALTDTHVLETTHDLEKETK